jgi:hypothetical protein
MKVIEETMPSGRRNGATRTMISRVFIPFYVPCKYVRRKANINVEIEAFLVDAVQRACRDVARHSPAYYRSSGTFSSTARHLFFNSFRLGDRGGLCVAQHGLYNWEKPGLHSFLCAV